jgi:cell division protein FtsL
MREGSRKHGRRWKNAAVVRETDRRRVRHLWSWLLGIVLALAPTVVYLLQQMRYVESRYHIESLRADRERLAEERRRLQVERASLQALRNVEARAARELGLVHPPEERVVVLTPRVPAPDGMMARDTDVPGR